MVTGASNADLAVILVDAVRGVTTQTRRHSSIAGLLGISAAVVAVNKMDLVGYDEARFRSITAEVSAIAEAVGLAAPVCIPVSALHGDGVVERGRNLSWYAGPCLMDHLEQVDAAAHASARQASGLVGGRLRLPVQLVIRPDHRFRGFAGTVCEGTLRAGDRVQVEPSGRTTTIERIVTFDGDLHEAETGRAVVVTTADEVDIGRGDVIVDLAQVPQRGRQLTATMVWMSQADLVVGMEYLLQQGGQTMSCRVSEVTGRLDVDTLESVPAAAVRLNDIARATVRTDTELIFDPYAQNRTTGSFILVDRADNATVAAGMIAAEVPEADLGLQCPDRHWSASEARSAARSGSERLGQRPATVLVTGLTGAGKSTIASSARAGTFRPGPHHGHGSTART